MNNVCTLCNVLFSSFVLLSFIGHLEICLQFIPSFQEEEKGEEGEGRSLEVLSLSLSYLVTKSVWPINAVYVWPTQSLYHSVFT